MSKKNEQIREIESYLRKYQIYKANIKNCKRQLNYLFPNVTASYEFEPKSGASFMISSTEKSAIDRIESKRALDLQEQIARSQTIVESIETALEALEEKEKVFVELRYFRCLSFIEIAAEMKQSERSIFDIKNRATGKLIISLANLLAL
jgi:RNA polymerase sigma factor (sigma-70 family)